MLKIIEDAYKTIFFSTKSKDGLYHIWFITTTKPLTARGICVGDNIEEFIKTISNFRECEPEDVERMLKKGVNKNE